MVETARFYFVGGYHLTVCPEAVMALAEEAAAKNKAIGQAIAGIIKHADILLGLHDVFIGSFHFSCVQGCP
jgi:sugar/nucleoside kinase (ribokinase family)